MPNDIASDNTPYKRLVEQAAASVPSAVAGGQNVFIDSSDNKLKRKNSSGTVFSIEAGEGTSFPASPATNDKYYRTDRNLLYYYDGTRWLTTQVFRETFFPSDNSNPTSTSGASLGAWSLKQGANGIYILTLESVTLVSTTNNGSNYWTVGFNWRTQGNANTLLTSFDTSGDTATNWYDHSVTVNAILDATARFMNCVVTKTAGAPGAIYVYPAISYRMIG